METKEYNEAEAKAYILGCFREQGDFAEIVDEKTLDEMVSAAMALDAAFMKETGADEGAVYDDDAAYDYMHERMCVRFAAHKMYMLRLVEDYMDYNERYLESLGLIDWE
ncbi:MAG: hypothetical protein LLF75_02300 [Eubacteriales bacterium]|nr:hypothetical protein [Eubacteriales bacterium]